MIYSAHALFLHNKPASVRAHSVRPLHSVVGMTAPTERAPVRKSRGGGGWRAPPWFAAGGRSRPCRSAWPAGRGAAGRRPAGKNGGSWQGPTERGQQRRGYHSPPLGATPRGSQMRPVEDTKCGLLQHEPFRTASRMPPVPVRRPLEASLVHPFARCGRAPLMGVQEDWRHY
jgi:hypothetical protein